MKAFQLGVLALGLCSLMACGANTVIDAKKYDRSCTAAADCTPIQTGDVCVSCACPTIAIGPKDLAVYTADAQAAQAACGSRVLCAAACRQPVITCELGACAIAP